MRRAKDRGEWRVGWLILTCCWLFLFAPLFLDLTPRLEGGRILALVTSTLLFAVLGWRWGPQNLWLAEWLLLPTALALFLTSDLSGAARFSYAGIAALLAPFVRAASQGK